MGTPEWTTPENLASVAADELEQALGKSGVITLDVSADEDGEVRVVFASLTDVECMMTLALEAGAPGTVYDRATSSCVSLSESSDEEYEAMMDAARDTGWKWLIHPHLSIRRVGWHVSVYMSAADANQVTANLNAARLGGAL